MAYDANVLRRATARLEEIVSLLERGDAPLEQAMALFEEGAGILRTCTAMLDQAEQKVTLLTAGPDGQPHGQPAVVGQVHRLFKLGLHRKHLLNNAPDTHEGR